MTEAYQNVLKRWVIRFLEHNYRYCTGNINGYTIDDIDRIDVREVEATGYCDTCYSPGYVEITVSFTDGAVISADSLTDESMTWGQLLRELLELEETEESSG